LPRCGDYQLAIALLVFALYLGFPSMRMKRCEQTILRVLSKNTQPHL